MANINVDVLVVGGSLGGVAAALAAARAGRTVALVSTSNWIGGQMTSQGVCTPDENQYVETTGSTRSYRDFRRRTRQYYETKFQLSAAGNASVQDRGHLDLGESWVSYGYSVEAKVAKATLLDILSEVGVVPILGATIGNVSLSDDAATVTGVTITTPDGASTTFAAAYVLDATDLGDLLPLANVEHFVGAESQAQTGEPDAAPGEPERTWIQPFTFPIALERGPSDANFTIPQPANYAAVKAAQNFTLVDGNISGLFVARPLPPKQGQGLIFWTYRRVVEAALFTAGPTSGDVANINVGSNDYLSAVIPSGDPDSDAAALAAAREVSLCYLYWLQTECPRDPGDGSGTGYPNLRPVTEFWDTPDAISPDPYIREGRRIQALTTVKEQDIAVEDANNHDLQTGPRARLFPDSCGIGSYPMDIHANNLGQVELDLATKPFQIPLGALVPVRVANVLPACKNLGVTHLTNGAYRLHPIEWNVGEAAGSLAAFCLQNNVTPAAVAGTPSLVTSFQNGLLANGVPIFWWSDVADGDPAFAATQILGVQGIFTGTTGLEFGPNETLTPSDRNALSERIAPNTVTWPDGPISRSQAAILLAAALAAPPSA
ncbi:MAG: FAD-dependent oxidoreductase [Capsulimonadaceae bacterium]